MSEYKVLANNLEVAETAANLTCQLLNMAIAEFKEATWLLAGGSTPMEAYKLIAKKYYQAVNWAMVNVVLGDERNVPTQSSESNWHQIRSIIKDLNVAESKQYIPTIYTNLNLTSKKYEEKLKRLPLNDSGVPRFDLAWLGIGNDGHTLSLFPNKELDSSSLVVAISDSPKPPPERISLSLKAMTNVKRCIIIVSGQDKTKAVSEAKKGNQRLPIVRVIKTIEANGGKVNWLINKQAASLLA